MQIPYIYMDVNYFTSFTYREEKIQHPGRVVIIGRKMNDPKKLYEDLSLESVYDEKGVRTLWKDMTSKNKMEQLQKISSAMLSATNFVYNGEAAEDTGNRNVSVCDILEKEMYSLAVQAKVITSEFYTFIETKDKTLDPVNLSCRSRITKDGYLEISWSRLEFFSANGKNYKKSTRLTKGASSFSYPMKTFEKLPSWAKDKVIGFEKKFSVLREKANALSKCRRQIENYKKLAEKSLN